MTSPCRSTIYAFVAMLMVHSVLAQSNIAPTPGQPSRNNAPLGQFEIVGKSIASGQQVSMEDSDRLQRN